MKNLKFYFYVIASFIIFCCSIRVNAAELGHVNFHVPNVDKIYNYENFYYSNFSEVPDGNVADLSSDIVFEKVGISNDCEDEFCSLKADSHKQLSSKLNSTFNFPPVNYDNEVDLINKITVYFNKDYSKLSKDKSYQLALKFIKSKSLNYNEHIINLDDLDITITDTDNFVPVSANDFISEFSAEWNILPDSENSNENGNIAFLIINFKFNSDDWLQNFNNFSLNNISIDVSNWSGSYLVSRDGFISNSDKKNYDFKISKVYFLEDGHISINKSSSNSSGGGRHDNLDNISEDELIKISDGEICETFDIPCHIRNLKSLIKNLFVRIGNGFITIIDFFDSIFEKIINILKSLFIPSDDFTSNFIDNFNKSFITKLGFLSYPFELICSLLNRYLNISTNPVINIPDIKEPFTGHVLISSRTFNFLDFFNYPEFKFLYDLYMSFVSLIIIFSFFNFSIKKFTEIVKNRSGY